MAEINNGGPAFPVARDWEFPKGSYSGDPKPGMSMRDWFAANAPEAPSWFVHIPAEIRPSAEDKDALELWERNREIDRFYAWRWHYADNMLKAREA